MTRPAPRWDPGGGKGVAPHSWELPGAGPGPNSKGGSLSSQLCPGAVVTSLVPHGSLSPRDQRAAGPLAEPHLRT